MNLTETQLASVLNFSPSLPPILPQLQELKTSFRKSAVAEFECYMKILVKDMVKILQTTFELRNTDTASAGVGERGRGMHSGHLNSSIIVLKYHLSGQNRLEVDFLPTGDKNSYRPQNGGSGR